MDATFTGLDPGLSECIGYWYWVYNILVYWVFPIHITNFVLFPIQYNTIQYNKEDDQGKKNMRERLNEIKWRRKSIQRTWGRTENVERVRDKRRGRGKFTECESRGEMKKRRRKGKWWEFEWVKDREEEEEEDQEEQKYLRARISG